jgi:hypothetical protein
MLLHYFVLEHVPSVRDFLLQCRRVLKPAGLMICEVPDLDLYPIDPVALWLHEHTNHFTRRTFARISQTCGFFVREFSKASRSFGFSAICEPVTEYDKGKTAFAAGIETLKQERAVMSAGYEALTRYLRHSHPVIFWAANTVAVEFFNKYPNLPSLTIVDADPAKAGAWRNHMVIPPSHATDVVRSAHAIFVCSSQHADEILRSINHTFGKVWPPNRIHVIDYHRVHDVNVNAQR